MSRRMWGITWLYFRGNGGESVVAEFKGGGDYGKFTTIEGESSEYHRALSEKRGRGGWGRRCVR